MVTNLHNYIMHNQLYKLQGYEGNANKNPINKQLSVLMGNSVVLYFYKVSSMILPLPASTQAIINILDS